MQKKRNRRNKKSEVSFNTDCASFQHYSLFPFSNLQKLYFFIDSFLHFVDKRKKRLQNWG